MVNIVVLVEISDDEGCTSSRMVCCREATKHSVVQICSIE